MQHKGWGEQPNNIFFIPRQFQLFSTAFCLLGRVLLILSGFRLPSFVGQTRKLLRFHLKSCFAGQTLGFTQVLMRKQECSCAFLTLKLEFKVLRPDKKGYTSYLSILVHRHIIKACNKYTNKRINSRKKAKIFQNGPEKAKISRSLC